MYCESKKKLYIHIKLITKVSLAYQSIRAKSKASENLYFYSLFLIILMLAPLCLQRKFNFLSSVRSTGLRTRACAFNLQVPYPRSNSGKRTFAYSAATLFNCLDSDLKQIACVSPSCIIYSSRLNNFKHKLFILFLISLLVTFLILKN